jgi:hypothetical protein
MTNLKNVTIYNLKNEIICSSVDGTLNQGKSAQSFNTNLNLSVKEPSKLVVGQTYYAIGLNEDNVPMRTEKISCKIAGNNPSFEGSIKFPEKPVDYQPKRATADASDADMLIQYTNYSSTQFDRSTWGANLQDGFGGLTNSPGPILIANAGQQSIGASQILGALDEGPADIYLCWASGINFGVWIHFNFQMFGLGPRPIWYVSTNGSNWALAGSNPADPYTWDTSAVGFNIVGTPTSGHSSLTVEVTITNLKG